MKVLVTGATGFIGSAACRALCERGHHVIAATRLASRADHLLAHNVKVCECDITIPDSLTAAFDGVEVVVHAAGVPRPARRSVFQRVHVEGTRHVLEAARQSRVKHIVNIASQAVLFDGNDIDLRDRTQPGSVNDHPGRFIDLYSETKAAAERIAMSFHTPGKMSVVSLRPAVVWGRGDSTILPILMRLSSRWPGMPCAGDGRNFEATTHIDNATAAIVAAVDPPEPIRNGPGACMVVVDGFEIQWREFYTRLLEAVNIKPRFVRVPQRPAAAGAWLLDSIAGVLSLPVPLSRFGLAMAVTSRRYNAAVGQQSLGYQNHVDLETGLADLHDWAESSGADRLPHRQ